MPQLPDGELIGLELIMNFFKTLNQQQAREIPASSYVQRKYIYEDIEIGSTFTNPSVSSAKPSIYLTETDAERKRGFFDTMKQF